jgi:hypothetical protein
MGDGIVTPLAVVVAVFVDTFMCQLVVADVAPYITVFCDALMLCKYAHGQHTQHQAQTQQDAKKPSFHNHSPYIIMYM